MLALHLLDEVAQRADLDDLGLHDVAGLHEFRRVAGDADAGRGAGGDDVAGLEREPRAQRPALGEMLQIAPPPVR